MLTAKEIEQLIQSLTNGHNVLLKKVNELESQLTELKGKFDEQKRPKTKTRRRKRIQQAEENAESPNEEVCSSSEGG